MSNLAMQVKPSCGRVAGALFALAISGCAWTYFHDDQSAPGTAVFGAYRDGWFLLCMVVTYCSLWAAAVSIWPCSRRVLLRIGLVHVGLILPLALTELVAFSSLVDFRSLLTRGTQRPTRNASTVDPRLRWVGLPNCFSEGTVLPDLVKILGAEASPISYSFQTDAQGLRNPSAKPDARVLCIGDSILVAGLVPIERVITEELERRLDVPVMNVAEVGYSPQEELIRLETLRLNLRGRLVVQFFFEGNDLADSETWRSWCGKEGSNWPSSGLTKAVLSLLHGPKRAAGARRVGMFVTLDGESVPVHFLYDADTIEARLTELDRLRATFRDAHSEIMRQGGAYAIVLVPAKLTVFHPYCGWASTSELRSPRFGNSKLRRRLSEICKEDGIPFQDLTPALRAVAARGELPYFAADTHLNAVGHAAAAKTLSSWMARLIPE